MISSPNAVKFRKFVVNYTKNISTHWGLVTPYGDVDLGQHWLRYWLVAWRHQAITWTNVDRIPATSSPSLAWHWIVISDRLLSEPLLAFFSFETYRTSSSEIWIQYEPKYTFFILHFKNVICKMAAILSQPWCVNWQDCSISSVLTVEILQSCT